MLGRHHLLISLFTVFTILAPFSISFSDLTLVVFLGVAVGALIPDVDSPDATIFHNKVKGVSRNLRGITNFFAIVFPAFGFVTKYLIYKPALLICKKTILKEFSIEEKHRGFLHSLIGLAFLIILTSLYLLIFILVFNVFSLIHFVLFVVGYSVGAFLHLVEDSCTKSGIAFKYPFSKEAYKGQIVTSPFNVSQPDFFMGFLMVTSLISFFLPSSLKIDPIIVSFGMFVLMLLSWFIFLRFIAKVRLVTEGITYYENSKSMF